MNIEQIVSGFAGVNRFPGLPDAWHWEVALPRLRFNYVLALTSDGRHALQVNVREGYDAALVRAVLAFALAHEREVLGAPTLAVLPGFAAAGSAFDTVVAAVPAVSQLHAVKHPELSAVAHAVFPAYRGEFSGRETPEEARYRKSKLVGSADLSREPRPVVRMRYANPRTQGGSIGPKRGQAKPQSLFAELEQLVDAPGGFVEFENYLGEVCKATCERDGGLTLWRGDQHPEPMRLPILLAWTEGFLRDGTEEARAPGFRPAEYPAPDWLDIRALLAARQARNSAQPPGTRNQWSLELEDGTHFQPSTWEEVERALYSLRLPGCGFAILARGGSTYMQTSEFNDGTFALEFREGSAAHHYVLSYQLDRENVVDAFRSYWQQDDAYLRRHRWEESRLP